MHKAPGKGAYAGGAYLGGAYPGGHRKALASFVGLIVVSLRIAPERICARSGIAKRRHRASRDLETLEFYMV